MVKQTPSGLGELRRYRQQMEENQERADFRRGLVGRPLKNEDDLKAARLGLRLHADLDFEGRMAARNDGVTYSQFIVRALVEALNARAGGTILDAFGKYIDDEPKSEPTPAKPAPSAGPKTPSRRASGGITGRKK